MWGLAACTTGFRFLRPYWGEEPYSGYIQQEASVRAWKKYTKLYLVFAFVLLSLGFLMGIGRFLVRGEFGRVPIRLRNGKSVYVVREARGLSSERVYLTRNPKG